MDSDRGNGDRHEREKGSRRRTISGERPNIDKPQRRIYVREIDAMRDRREGAESVPTEARPATPNTPAASAGRKRSGSGSLFSRLNFLRSNSGEDGNRPSPRAGKEATSPVKSSFSRKEVDGKPDVPEQALSPTLNKEGALASALKENRPRRRKGSLRKTALLGGRRNVMEEGRETKGGVTVAQGPPLIVQPAEREDVPEQAVVDVQYRISVDDDIRSSEDSDPRIQQSMYEHETAASSTESGLAEPAAVSAARLSLLTDRNNRGPRQPTADDQGSPVDVKSPTSQASFTSTTTTTSDEDVLTFDRPAKGLPLPITKDNGPPSYFPIGHSTTSLSSRSRASLASGKRRSPLSRTLPLTPSKAADPALPHDYTETATWGYILLASTWITFTVGMGSCLGLWSWAWDVGETPYAPPELEDDPTLPIVGYYPALMVLTGVVAWVWITVAWVGMKYFRHAKIEV